MKVKFQFWRHSGIKFSILVFLIPSIVIELYRSPKEAIKIYQGFIFWIRFSWLLWTFRIKITNQDIQD